MKKNVNICTINWILCTIICTFTPFNLSSQIYKDRFFEKHIAECSDIARYWTVTKAGTALGICYTGESTMNAALTAIKNDNYAIGRKKDYVNNFRMSEPKCGVLFSDFIDLTTNRKSKRMGERYRDNYLTLIYHINKFSEQCNATIYTNSVNEEFMDDFIVYLESENLKQTYIKNIISLTKSMARKAGTYGYAVDHTFDDVTLPEEDSFSVYLSMNEITRIYYFRGLTKKQERIKDLFVVGCLTALRYSDYSSLTRENFNGNYIHKVTKKTGKRVVIPIHDYVREIFNKYDGEISSGLSLQHFNRYLKSITKKIGLDSEVTYSYTRGGVTVTETKQKWELISSHTARRSAATNMYLTGRMKTFEIMSLTGHTTEKSFFRYIRVTGDDISKQLSGDNFFRT